MINRAEPRACGTADTKRTSETVRGLPARATRPLDKVRPGESETKPSKPVEGKARPLRKPSSNRTEENSPYGMNRGDWGNTGSNAACAPVLLD